MYFQHADKITDYVNNNTQIIDTGINRFKTYKPEYETDKNEEFDRPYNNAEFNNISPNELSSLDDKVKDKINLNETPENERDGIFIYYNGKVYILYNPPDNDWWVNHQQLLYVITNDPILYKKLSLFRLESYNVKKTVKNVGALAFGHICRGNVAVIDLNAVSNRVNSEIVKSALIQAGCKKVYVEDLINTGDFRDLMKIKRIAKRLIKKIS